MIKGLCDNCKFVKHEYKYNDKYRKYNDYIYCKAYYIYIKTLRKSCDRFRDKSCPDIGKIFEKFDSE